MHGHAKPNIKNDTKCGLQNPNPNASPANSSKGGLFAVYLIGIGFLGAVQTLTMLKKNGAVNHPPRNP